MWETSKRPVDVQAALEVFLGAAWTVKRGKSWQLMRQLVRVKLKTEGFNAIRKLRCGASAIGVLCLREHDIGLGESA